MRKIYFFIWFSTCSNTLDSQSHSTKNCQAGIDQNTFHLNFPAQMYPPVAKIWTLFHLVSYRRVCSIQQNNSLFLQHTVYCGFRWNQRFCENDRICFLLPFGYGKLFRTLISSLPIRWIVERNQFAKVVITRYCSTLYVRFSHLELAEWWLVEWRIYQKKNWINTSNPVGPPKLKIKPNKPYV